MSILVFDVLINVIVSYDFKSIIESNVKYQFSN
jgi:hypothetical protein